MAATKAATMVLSTVDCLVGNLVICSVEWLADHLVVSLVECLVASTELTRVGGLVEMKVVLRGEATVD